MPHGVPIELPSWREFAAVAGTSSPGRFGFNGGWKLTNRFRARYRLAKGCSGLRFDDREYSDTIAAGYDALTRCLLAWSAFEMYAELTGHSRNDILRRRGANEMIGYLRTQQLVEPFYLVVHENLNHSVDKAEFSKFLAGAPCNPSKVLGAIRHVFAHGYLTPSAGGGNQVAAASVCTDIARYLLTDVIDIDWASIVNEVLDELRRHGQIPLNS